MDLFIYSDTSICATIAFPPLGNSDHVVVSVSIDFPTNSKQDALFHCIADLTILKLIRTIFVIFVFICHHKYQVKTHLSPWFSAACAAVIVHRNHFFVCCNRINLLNLK